MLSRSGREPKHCCTDCGGALVDGECKFCSRVAEVLGE